MKGLSITALLREREILDRVQSAFRRRELPEEVFYWFPSSVRAWAELCSSSEYRNTNRALEVLTAAAPALTERIDVAHSICGLGCGEGSKDAVLLEAFKGVRNGPSGYVGADFSQALLELALEEAKRHVLYVSGYKCDLGKDADLLEVCHAATQSDTPAIFTVLGNTLGAFDPRQFPLRLRCHLRRNDWFLFDGEIFSEQTLGGYDNPTNRRFAWGPLTGVGITEEDGRLEFSSATIGDGLLAVTKQFVAIRDLRLNIGGEGIEIAAGEKLRMSSSIKYASESVLLGFVERAAFQIESRWSSSDGNFILACARTS
ncbi:MAG: L-histidine N(alpha)-methyltransferase [Terriglobales bacterium]